MMSNQAEKIIKLTFHSPGIQSYAYYLDSISTAKIERGEFDTSDPWPFIERNAKKEVNLSYGICLDHGDFKIVVEDAGRSENVGMQHEYDALLEGVQKHRIQIPDEPIKFSPDEPDPEENGIILEYSRYQAGSIFLEVHVRKDFKFSDFTLLWRSLDYESPFFNERLYQRGANTLDDAEQEVVGLKYLGKDYFFAHSLSFDRADMTIEFLSRENDGQFCLVSLPDTNSV